MQVRTLVLFSPFHARSTPGVQSWTPHDEDDWLRAAGSSPEKAGTPILECVTGNLQRPDESAEMVQWCEFAELTNSNALQANLLLQVRSHLDCLAATVR